MFEKNYFDLFCHNQGVSTKGDNILMEKMEVAFHEEYLRFVSCVLVFRFGKIRFEKCIIHRTSAVIALGCK